MLTGNQMGQPKKIPATEQQILYLGRILQRLREEDNIEALIATTVAYLREQFDYQLVWVALYDRLNHILLGKGGVIPEHDLNFLRQRVVLNPGDVLEQVVISQSPVGIADLGKEPRASEWNGIAQKFKIQGTVILPIRYRNNCLGIVLLGSQRWGYLLAGEARERLLIVLGELGSVLYKQEIELQQKQVKRSDEPWLKLVENINSLKKLDQKLEAIVAATHQHITPNRTNVYWFERQGRYFWCRMSSQMLNMGRYSTPEKTSAGMTVQELSDLYYALATNQIVWIGEGRSSLKSNFTGKLLQRLQVRSLLAAPIIWQKDLIGFLAVESHEARIWTEGDKNFVQGAAGLISLIAPTEDIQNAIEQIERDNQLTNQIAQAIHNEVDLERTLQICGTKILERLAGTRFLLLQFDREQNNYQILYQINPPNRRSLSLPLESLSEVDANLLQYTQQTIEVENFDEDLRFFNWHSYLLENNVRSLLICNCVQGHNPEILLLITHEHHRSWKTLEKELIWVVSQHIGVIVNHWQLRSLSLEQQKITKIFKKITSILVEDVSGQIEAPALKQVANLLDTPLALMLAFTPGENVVNLITGVIANSKFGVNQEIEISREKEPLIEMALAENSYKIFKADDITSDTKRWLKIPEKCQIFLMALRTTGDYQPTSVVLFANLGERVWSEPVLEAAATLITQLAWWIRQQQVLEILESSTEKLQQLNWYKHCRLEETQRMLGLVFRQINDLGIPSNELTQMRYRLLLRQLDHIATSMIDMINQEQWQLHISWESMSITSILKRSLERVDNLVKERQLWIGVHGLGQPLEEKDLTKTTDIHQGFFNTANQSTIAIAGDIIKIELVIHELLTAACNRSPDGERIDIWCRRLDEQFLELSITDHGTIEPQLLVELHHETPKDLLTHSLIYQPPGLHLLICQEVVQKLGGELQFYQLQDHRIVSRLVLPLAPHHA
ncbi:MAG TPA: GAF domain-containing protein [Nostocaceae cyanobacterium]|nr:GAF domain-containing protein [Nostocaceae cyanobacterium]